MVKKRLSDKAWRDNLVKVSEKYNKEIEEFLDLKAFDQRKLARFVNKMEATTSQKIVIAFTLGLTKYPDIVPQEEQLIRMLSRIKTD